MYIGYIFCAMMKKIGRIVKTAYEKRLKELARTDKA